MMTVRLACAGRPSRSISWDIICRLFSSNRKIQEHEVLFLRQQGKKYPKWHLTAPLQRDSRVKLSYGASIEANELIGRTVLDMIQDSAGNRVVVHEPTLSSYIVNSERHATPIYPHDANTIVSLMDLNPTRPGEDDEDTAEGSREQFEIFEAGTGMGSLTLHLARAIHAANPPMAPSLRHALCSAGFRTKSDSSLTRVDLDEQAQAALDAYCASRRAVIHTLDFRPKHTHAAYKLIRNFRRAMYLPSIDFHVGTVDEYLNERLRASLGEPFLSRAILDLPSAHDNAESVIRALKPDGILILFKPSISQIADFQRWSAETRQPVRLEKVIELPVSTTSDGVHDAGAGRHWDVKTVVPRSWKTGDGEDKVAQVMRPKVGERIAGGGFVAVLRRWPAFESADEGRSEETEGAENSASPDITA